MNRHRLKKHFTANFISASVILAAGGITLTCSGHSSRIEMKSKLKRPNIIVILADDLGYGDLGGYYGGQANTPQLNRLAQEGMLFTDFHSNGAMCSPTRAALLTGRYQQRLGIETS